MIGVLGIKLHTTANVCCGLKEEFSLLFRTLLLVSHLSELDLSDFSLLSATVPVSCSSEFHLQAVIESCYHFSHRGCCKDETNFHHSFVIMVLSKNHEMIVAGIFF